MGEYIEKNANINENSKNNLQFLVKEEFKRIEGINGIGIRDDQEIYNAGWNICNKLIKEIKNDESKNWGWWSLEPLTNLILELKKEYKKMTGTKLFTKNKIIIDQIANKIDNAENEVLKRLAKNRTTQNSRNIVKKSQEINRNNPMFVMEGGNDVKKQTGCLVFTKAANPVRIDQALKGLFDNPDKVYEIDYSKCDTSTPKGKEIKEKMMRLIGTKTCYLRYDKEQKTYTIRDKDGIGISDRAYIWEGVKLIPAGVRKWQAYNEEKKDNEKLGKETVLNGDKLGKLTLEMLEDMPSVKKEWKDGKYTSKEVVELCQKTEIRLNTLLKKAKSLGYELEPECVTRKRRGHGHMELHLNSGSSEVDRTIWGNDGSYNKDLGKKLDDLVDSNEVEYGKYLTKRVKQKWQEFERLTKTETIDVGKKGQKPLTQKEKEQAEMKKQQAEMKKQQMLYGILQLEKMIDSYRESTGDSWLGDDDKRLVKIKKLIRNAKASISESNILDDNAIIKNFIDPMWDEWSRVKRLSKSGMSGTNDYKDQYGYFKNVFFGEKDKQIVAIRELGGHGRLFDNTETSFLAEEIEGNDDLGVKKPEIQKCIDKIKNRTTMSIYNKDGSINQKVKGRYDNTYASAKKGTDSLITLFVGRGWLPQNWKDEEKEVMKCMDNLRNSLNSIDSQVNNLNLSVDSMIKEQHQKRLKLEQKENKTEEDMIMLQSLVYLENNPNEARKSYQKAIEINNIEMKYGNLGQMVKGGLMSALGELGGGIIGKNADIYNDIKGYGRFNLSDENAKIAGDLIGDILEEVVVLAVAIAIGTVTAGVGTAAIMGVRATRWGVKAAKYTKYVTRLTKRLTKPVGKIVKNTGNFVKTSKPGKYIAKTAERAKNTKLGKNISKIRTEQDTARAAVSQQNKAEILHLWRTENKTLGEMYRLGTLVNKEGSMGIKAVSAIFEGTGFHLSSTAIHNAINGVDLTTGLNPFGYTEGPNGEKISNFKGYVQSIAFLGILKALGHPIQNLTQASLTTVLGEKISANVFGKILQQIGSIGGEFGTLTLTDETINVIFEGELKELTVEDVVHSLGMILGLRAYGKIKKIANLKIKKYNRNKQELKVEIDGKDVIVNEGTLDRLTNPNKTEQKLAQGNTGNDKVTDRATERLHENFDKQIMLENGITIDGITYKLERRPNEGHNPNRKGRIVYTETGPDGKIKVKIEANSDTFVLPENSNGNRIRERFNSARGKYVERNLNSTLESARNDLDGEFSRDIDLKSKDLEGRRKDRAVLEGKKKNLSDEIDGLKSRKAQLEQQLQNISKELTIQPNIVSLKDIYSIIKEGNIVSIGGKKMKFIGVKGDKIAFTEGKGKTREFSSFKELQDAKANFNFDIKNRQSERGLEQQIMFEELVGKEARTKNANEIIREYESLQRQKTQIEQDIRDGFFRENAIKLKGKHIWIDGIEYQCTDIKTNNGRTTLDFKKTDGSDSFTISSFEQLKAKGQVNGFGDRYDVIDKETRAAGRELSRYERENHELLRGENGLFKGGNKYVENKRQSLQQVEQQLKDGRANYDNAKLATSPKRVPNPEYERIQKEIEGIDAQLIEKGQELANVERNLGASDTEIARIEQEITNLTAERENLSRNENEIGNRGSDGGNEGSEGNHIETPEEIKTSEDVVNKLDEIKLEPESGDFENVKLDWVTKSQFETGVFIEGVHRRFKNISLKPNMKLPKEFLKKMGDKLVDMKNTWGEKLGEYHRKLIDKYNSYIERKLAEKGEEVEIKKEEIDIIEKSSKTFGEYNQEFADIIRNNQNKIINLEKIENMDSFINESFKFLKEEMGIDDPNLKIKILEGTEGIDNHYDRSTNTVYFSRNFGGERQIYLKGGNKAETFGGIGHELNHYLQEVEIIKHYLKDNETINTFVEGIMNESDKERINRYINQIDFNEPISERAIKYAKYYTEAGKDKTIFDKNGKILDHNKYRNLGYEKESFDRGDILADEYRKTTKSYKEQQRRQREEQERRQREEQERRQREEQERRQREEPQINGNERPDRGINTERREISEVQRNSDVVAIGDLHGSYIALEGNMLAAGLTKEVNGHLEWIGGNKKVVFQGDILADRGTDGLKIIKEIHQLREQARKEGGDIDIIVGNHDDFMIAYLLGGKVSRFAMNGEASALDIAMNGSQGKGLTELLDFIGIKRTGEFDDFFNLSRKNNEILNAMRNSPEGRMILEEICNMKLVSQVDDVLYCHTNPTSRMLQYLTRGNIQTNINTLNQKYQGFLKKALLGEGNGNISMEEFNNISDIFLNTGNRDISGIENYVEQLRNSGINMISHGHSGGGGEMNGRKIYNNNSVNINGLRIVDTDYSYGKGGNTNRNYSISVIKKDYGKLGGGSEVYEKLQSQEYQLGQEVYVKRSAGGESRARVEGYNPRTKEYTVRWEEGGQRLEKTVKSESLREVNVNEKLDIICEEGVTLENCGLSEEQINQVFKNFGKIKEITGKNKIGRWNLKRIAEINESVFDNILNLKSQIKEITGEDVVSLELIEKFSKISGNHLNEIIRLKGKINQLIGKIRVSDIPKLIDISEGAIDNIIGKQGKIKEITGKEIIESNDLRYFKDINRMTIDTLKDSNIRQKLEQVTGENKRNVSNIAELSKIENLDILLDNIINNRTKLEQVTGKDKRAVYDVKNLSKIGNLDIALDNIIKNRTKLEQVTGKNKRTANDIESLLEIGNLDIALDNIINNRTKLEQVTGKDKLAVHDVKNLSEIGNLDITLDNIINHKTKLEQIIGKEIHNFPIWNLKSLQKITTDGINKIIHLKEKIDDILDVDGLEVQDIENLLKLNEKALDNLITIKNKYGYKVISTKGLEQLQNFTENDFIKIHELTGKDPRITIESLSRGYKKIEFIDNKLFKRTKTNGTDYIVLNEYGNIQLDYIGNKTYIFHAGMHPKEESPSQGEIMKAQALAGRAFYELHDVIPEGYKISETLSLSGDSFPLFLREYQKDFRTDYIVRATGKKIFLNSQGKMTPESQKIQKKHVKGRPDKIFEAATQADAQEVADEINKLMKDRGQPLVEGQRINELAEATVVQSPETGLWRVEIPQIEMVKQHNNGVELSQQLNKCTTYNEMENILLANLSIEYHFRDGTLTGKEILNRFTTYRKGRFKTAKDEDPRSFFPSEFIEPTKRRTKEGIPTWQNTTRKSNIHKLLDS